MERKFLDLKIRLRETEFPFEWEIVHPANKKLKIITLNSKVTDLYVL
jgi:hypothetical protein